MKEKERYVIKVDFYGNADLIDLKHEYNLRDLDHICDFLNQQDQRIKELEEKNKVGEFWHSAYKCKQLEYDQIYAELTKSYEENHQLKQSQKELAIDKLEKLRKKFCDMGYNGDYDIDYFGVMKEIDITIKKLKGE